MTDPLTLAHLTDVHLAPVSGFTVPNWRPKRVLGYANWMRGRRRIHRREVADLLSADVRSMAPDHIVVTGDLVNLGLAEEHAQAARWLAELGPPSAVTVIPGNHDIYASRRDGRSCLTAWAPYLASDEFGLKIGVSGAGIFPAVRRVGGIALIALNSAEPTPPFIAAGRLGREQREALTRVLAHPSIRELVRVVLIHHPPFAHQTSHRRGLRDARELQRILVEHGAEIVLHGHEHTETLEWLQTRSGNVAVLGGASLSAARPHKDEPLGRYNLFRITRQEGTILIEQTVRGFDPVTGGVRELAHRALRSPA